MLRSYLEAIELVLETPFFLAKRNILRSCSRVCSVPQWVRPGYT
jgi:hypothetical protein